MRDKLRIERKDLENYQQKITHTKSQVDVIDTPEDGNCLGFTYIDEDGVLVYIFYHEPSLCFVIHRVGDTPREISLQHPEY